MISKDYEEFNFDESQKYFRKPELFYNANDCYCITIKDFVNFLYSQLRDFVKEFEKYLIEEENRKIKNSPKFNLRVNSDCVSLCTLGGRMSKSKKYRIKQKDFRELEKLAVRIYNITVVLDYFCQKQQEYEELRNITPIIHNVRHDSDTLNAYFINYPEGNIQPQS